MNKHIPLVSILLLTGILTANLVSCKKDDKNSSPATGTFYFHIHTNIDSNEVDDTSMYYADATGRHFALSHAQFYISNVTLKNANGTSYLIPTYLLKTIDSEDYLIGTAPVGTYTGVSFVIGVDASANSIIPSSYPATSALANTSMWFGDATKGYMFMKVEGFADTTAAQTGTTRKYFSYEIGAARNLKTITMPSRSGIYAPYILQANGTQYIHLICDYGKLLTGIDFKTRDTTNTYVINPTLADSIANNTANFIHYEE